VLRGLCVCRLQMVVDRKGVLVNQQHIRIVIVPRPEPDIGAYIRALIALAVSDQHAVREVRTRNAKPSHEGRQ
jgi:hypothetical protein